MVGRKLFVVFLLVLLCDGEFTKVQQITAISSDLSSSNASLSSGVVENIPAATLTVGDTPNVQPNASVTGSSGGAMPALTLKAASDGGVPDASIEAAKKPSPLEPASVPDIPRIFKSMALALAQDAGGGPLKSVSEISATIPMPLEFAFSIALFVIAFIGVSFAGSALHLHISHKHGEEPVKVLGKPPALWVQLLIIGFTTGPLLMMKIFMEKYGLDTTLCYVLFSQFLGTIANFIGEIFMSGVPWVGAVSKGKIFFVFLMYLLIMTIDTLTSLPLYLAFLYWFAGQYKRSLSWTATSAFGLITSLITTVTFVTIARSHWALKVVFSPTWTEAFKDSLFTYHTILIVAVFIYAVVFFFLVTQPIDRYMVESICVNEYNAIIQNSTLYNRATQCLVYEHEDLASCVYFCEGEKAFSLRKGGEQICDRLTELKDNNGNKCTSSSGGSKSNLLYAMLSFVGLVVVLLLFTFLGYRKFGTAKSMHDKTAHENDFRPL